MSGSAVRVVQSRSTQSSRDVENVSHWEKARPHDNFREREVLNYEITYENDTMVGIIRYNNAVTIHFTYYA